MHARCFTPSGSRSAAFTVVEVLVSLVILSLLLGGLYKLFSTVSRIHSMGSWVNLSTNELRNGMNLVRQEVSRATPPQMVTQVGSEDWNDPSYRKFYYPADTNTINNMVFPRGAGDPDINLIKVFMCQPGRKDIVGEDDIDPEIIQGLLKLKGNSLVYSRKIISQGARVASKTAEIKQVVCTNVQKIKIEVTKEDTASLSVKLRNFLRLEVHACHPRYTDTKIEQIIEPSIEVEGQAGGILND